MKQHSNRNNANPKKWVMGDIECTAGCGVVPFKYKENSFVNALQWVIGLEIFLLVDDPMAGCFDNGSSERWSFYILSSFDKTSDE